ncbi:transposase [Aureimonas sp. OT7]|nr:transposase [Aureimonas sp. OT7]
MISSSSIRVHQHAANGPKKDERSRCMGRSRGGVTTKIHALVAAECRPIHLKLTERQAHDVRSAADMFDTVEAGHILLAGRAYDGDALRAAMAERGAWAKISPARHRSPVSIPSCPACRRYAPARARRSSAPPPRRQRRWAQASAKHCRRRRPSNACRRWAGRCRSSRVRHRNRACWSQGHGLVAVEAVEKDRHGECGGLPLGNAFIGETRDEIPDVAGTEHATIARRMVSCGSPPSIPLPAFDGGLRLRNRARTFPFSAWVYRQRSAVERFFSKLKHFRAIATRYDKRDDNFLASVQLASIRIWLRSYESITWCSACCRMMAAAASPGLRSTVIRR